MESQSKKLLARALSRRGFGAAALATTAAYATGGAFADTVTVPGVPTGQSPVGSGPYDVAIIGAGIAGIGAARVCRAAKNVKYIVLEAQSRVGGRCYCDNSFPAPFDVGGQWFHFVTPRADGKPGTNNPLFDLAETPQFKSRLRPKPDPNLVLRTFYRGGQPVPQFDPDLLDVELLQIGMLGAISVAGAAESSAPKSPDITAAAATADFAREVWYEYVSWMIAIAGGPLNEQSVLDLYNDLKLGLDFSAALGNWLTPFGMGNFIALLSEGLPIQVNTPVTSISWGDKGGVAIKTEAGTLTAKTAIITIPPAVLAAADPSQVKFTPSLPQSQLEAIAAIKMALVEKVGLQFSKNVFGPVGTNTFAQLLKNKPLIKLIESRFWGHNMGVCIVDGPTAADLAKQGQPALVDFALEVVKEIFLPDKSLNSIRKDLVKSNTSLWSTDKYSRGAYSFVGPGDVPMRTVLRGPVGDQLFFAGEACSIDKHSSLPGAWETGRHAATHAIGALQASRTFVGFG